MKKPTISVIMPVYNGETYLKDAIESILNQTYTNFELIILNDGSSDDTEKIILSYTDPRIVYIKNEKNLKLVKTLNKGIKLSRGEYIARMDADDISLPDRFEEQINFMKNNNIDISGSHFFVINKFNNYIDSSIVPIGEINFLNYLCITPPFAHSSVMIRKSFIIEHHLSYEDTKDNYAEDYTLWIEFWNNNARFGNVDKFLFKYRDFSESLSKENRKNISRNRQRISKAIVLKNQKKILRNYDDIEFVLLSKREQELITITLLLLIKYDFSFKYFKYFKKLNKRALLFGIINFFKIGY